MTNDKMSVIKVRVDKMTVDEMSIEEMIFCRWKWYKVVIPRTGSIKLLTTAIYIFGLFISISFTLV